MVTGASRGIGAALRHALAARGIEVAGTSTSGGDGLLPLDLRDPEAVRTTLTATDAPLDLLVCNAGVFVDRRHDIEDYTAEDWAETLAVNVTGTFLCIAAALPRLEAAGGKVAILSSRMGSSRSGSGGSYAYRASKAASANLAHNLAIDLAPRGIAVGAYHPGWVRTEMGGPGADISPEEAARGLLDRIDALTLQTTGCFQTWDGRDIPY
ncbi:SDR family NAD(P)-dependent oxidoreductase [Histidinibacterium lentulum]|uniref:SDR family NAD(P)-dependent oxidoreductase n=1 Tax=Histidinibacterium lentulum TaxID=2480588 RepID=A0A3N2QVF0_9RHOB|nr:SDR family NAD(P)-dependent oxidoreductase [Histidinibacterium lentulum]